MTVFTSDVGPRPGQLAATRAGLRQVVPEHPVRAARTIHQIATAAEAAAFFRDGGARVLARTTATP